MYERWFDVQRTSQVSIMKLLADENFPLTSIKILSQAGHDILGIGIDYHGISDEEVIQFAQEEERIIQAHEPKGQIIGSIY